MHKNVFKCTSNSVSPTIIYYTHDASTFANAGIFMVINLVLLNDYLPARSRLDDRHAVSLSQARVKKYVTLVQYVLDLRVLETTEQSYSMLEQIPLPYLLDEPSLRSVATDQKLNVFVPRTYFWYYVSQQVDTFAVDQS